jgi:hypothetical protein
MLIPLRPHAETPLSKAVMDSGWLLLPELCQPCQKHDGCSGHAELERALQSVAAPLIVGFALGCGGFSSRTWSYVVHTSVTEASDIGFQKFHPLVRT